MRPGAEQPTLDVVFSLLSNERRRVVIDVLRAQESPIPLVDLAEQVARQERTGGRPAGSKEAVTGVTNALYHLHLPQLVDAAVVEFRRGEDEEVVSLADGATRILSILEHVEGSGAVPTP